MRRGLAAVLLLACQSGDPGAPGAPCEFTHTTTQPLGPPPQMITMRYSDVAAGTTLLVAKSTCTDQCVWKPSDKPTNAQPNDFVVGKCEKNCFDPDGGMCLATELCEPVFIDMTFFGACFDQTIFQPDAG
jgi:hypothetical protein